LHDIGQSIHCCC